MDITGNWSIFLENFTQQSTIFNETNLKIANSNTKSLPQWYESGRIQIPLYAIIFMLSVIGNTLVILTLVYNQKMRTITNLFLLNLAVSDLLLGVLCMPFTLIGALLRHFIFGKVMCKLLPFLQACSVSVGAWTLVAISVERYYAICHPLRSLQWQTISHAYKLICTIWIASLISMAPIAILSELKPTKEGNNKCRENWHSKDFEKAYTLFLDVILLIIPLLVMVINYSLITKSLYNGMKNEQAYINYNENGSVNLYVKYQEPNYIRNKRNSNKLTNTQRQQLQFSTLKRQSDDAITTFECCSTNNTSSGGLRRTNVEKNLQNKKRVVKMLFTVVLEFFICWTPLYMINTIAHFNPMLIYNNLGYKAISFFQLLAFASSCCNPITYCFMNRAFRKSFLNVFQCLNSHTNRFKRKEQDYNDVEMEIKGYSESTEIKNI